MFHFYREYSIFTHKTLNKCHWNFPFKYIYVYRHEIQLMPSLVEQELLTLPEHLSSPPVFSGVCVTRSLVLCVYFVDRCLSFFFWSLCCLFFFDIQILITPLVSSNSFYFISNTKKNKIMHNFINNFCSCFVMVFVYNVFLFFLSCSSSQS
jgi:hypothetical protein